MATWSGFSDREVSDLKVKLKDGPGNREATTGETRQTQSKSNTGTNIDDPDVNEKQQQLSPNDEVEESNEMSLKTLDVSLEVLQEQQEDLKQENLNRKMKIESALKERYEKSSKEFENLRFVKEELSKMDSLVGQDVSMLREKIEEADRTFNKARNRFELAEKEYVAAKLAFYDAKEKKDLLSEHLCTIIRHAEMRKSCKLKSLMSSLKIEDTSPSQIKSENSPKLKKPHAPEDVIPLGASMISIQQLD